MAWLVTGYSAEVCELLAKMKLKDVFGNPIPRFSKTKMGQAQHDYFADEVEGVNEFVVDTSLGVLLRDEKSKPIGVTTMGIKWKSYDTVVEVEIFEVWITPARRRKGLSTLMAQGVVHMVNEHLQQVGQLLTGKELREITLMYLGDVVTQAGGHFIRDCAIWHQELLELDEVDYSRLWVSDIDYYLNW